MGEIKRLPEAEEMVMAIVWRANEDLGMEEIRKKVNEKNHKEWKPQTVSTFLTRLRRKGYLTFYRKGRYMFYQPKISLEDYRKFMIDTIMSRLY